MFGKWQTVIEKYQSNTRPGPGGEAIMLTRCCVDGSLCGFLLVMHSRSEHLSCHASPAHARATVPAESCRHYRAAPRCYPAEASGARVECLHFLYMRDEDLEVSSSLCCTGSFTEGLITSRHWVPPPAKESTLKLF